jgi:hypothetical protein
MSSNSIYKLKQHPSYYADMPHTMEDRTPYTYLIGWGKLDKWYYGRKTGKHCHPKDFFVKYFTSSNRVKEFIKEVGLPDVIQIRQIFDNTFKTALFEENVTTKIFKLENWLNNQPANGKFDTTGFVSTIGGLIPKESFDTNLHKANNKGRHLLFDNVTNERVMRYHPENERFIKVPKHLHHMPQHKTTNRVVVKDSVNSYKQISSEEFKTKEYEGSMKGSKMMIDPTTKEVFRILESNNPPKNLIPYSVMHNPEIAAKSGYNKIKKRNHLISDLNLTSMDDVNEFVKEIYLLTNSFTNTAKLTGIDRERVKRIIQNT